jgi:hypothetical protein
LSAHGNLYANITARRERPAKRVGREALRRLGLQSIELARAQVGTIRLKLLKIGAVITRNTRRVRIWYSSAFALKELFKSYMACFEG